MFYVSVAPNAELPSLVTQQAENNDSQNEDNNWKQ